MARQVSRNVKLAAFGLFRTFLCTRHDRRFFEAKTGNFLSTSHYNSVFAKGLEFVEILGGRYLPELLEATGWSSALVLCASCS